MDQRIAMNPNRLVQYLQKPASEFTRAAPTSSVIARKTKSNSSTSTIVAGTAS